MYLCTVFARIACKEASLFGVTSCSCTSASTFYKLLEIERPDFVRRAPILVFPQLYRPAGLENGHYVERMGRTRTSYHLSTPICQFLPHLHDWLTTNPAGIIAGAMTQHGHKDTQQSVANIA